MTVLMICSEHPFLYQWIQGYFTLSFVTVSVHLVFVVVVVEGFTYVWSDFCERWKIWIYLYYSTCSCPIWKALLLKILSFLGYISSSDIKSQVSIGGICLFVCLFFILYCFSSLFFGGPATQLPNKLHRGLVFLKNPLPYLVLFLTSFS